MDRGDIGMVDAGCGPGFPQETAPGRFVTEELCTNDLQSHRAPEVGIDGFIGYSHASMPQFQGLSVLISRNLVMLKAELGRGIRNRVALGLASTAQGANGAVETVVRQQRTTHRAGSFGRGCRHRMLLSARMLLRMGLQCLTKNRLAVLTNSAHSLEPASVLVRRFLCASQEFLRPPETRRSQSLCKRLRAALDACPVNQAQRKPG
jgi:hypothetical protein